MRRRPEAFLWDIREAAARIREFVGDLDLAGFSRSTLVQAAVERQFEIIGEALNQLRGSHRKPLSRFPTRLESSRSATF